MSSAVPIEALPVSSRRRVAAAPRDAISARACRMIAAGLIVGVVAFHLFYLTWRCPIDLAEDEAYYWDWSREIDMSYYSKGPATALLIRASCTIFGNTMPAVRFPAVFLRAGVAVMTYWLGRRLFQNDVLSLISAPLR